MYLGHDQSSPANVHPLAASGVPLVRYPPLDVVRKYETRCSARGAAPPGGARRVFVGQVPTMMPPMYLAWAIDTVAGKYVVVRVEPMRKSGCAMAFVRPEDLALVLRRSRGVLFDVHGMWMPETPQQLEAMHRYCGELRQGEFAEVHADGRVPKGCIVLEAMAERGAPLWPGCLAMDVQHCQLHWWGAAPPPYNRCVVWPNGPSWPSSNWISA